MNSKFQNKYRIPSARAPWWDYGDNAAYFITICTHNREHYFGKIIQNTMQLSEIGKQAQICWNAISEHFPFVILDEFVVMPNHIHGILIFNKIEETQNFASENADGRIVIDKTCGMSDVVSFVETQNFASLTSPSPSPSRSPSQFNQQADRLSTKNNFGPQSQNLGSVLRGFKIGVTKFANSHHLKFAWQPRFHDHIIRNYAEFQRIKHYILTNPEKWNDVN